MVVISAVKQTCIVKLGSLPCLLHVYVSVFCRHEDSIATRRMSKDCRGLSNSVLARNSGRVAATSLRVNQAKQSSDMYAGAH
jgi:hypothetical protein